MLPVIIIAALFLAAGGGLGRARAEDFCPQGSLGNYRLALNESGAVFSATGCIVTPDSILTIDATALPSLIGGDGALIQASFTSGAIGVGGGIQFVGPSSDGVEYLSPILITISNNAFGADGAIRLYGSLPPHSHVIVSHNVLSVSRAIFADINELMFASPIYMYEYRNPFTISNSSGYTISGNTVTCSSPGNQYACFGIGLWGTLRLDENAFLNVSHNIVSAVGTDMWWSNGIDGMKDIYVRGEGTQIIIDGNNVTLEKGSGIEPPLVYTDANHNDGAGDFSTYVSISHNRFVGWPDPSYPEAMYLEAFIITANSVYNVSYNYIEVWGTDAKMTLNGQIMLYGESRLSIDHNTIVAKSGGTPQIGTRAGGWVLNGNSRAGIFANHLHRDDNAFPNRPFIQFEMRFLLLDTSRFYVLGNNLTARNTTRPYLIVGSTASTYVYKTDEARFKVCYNYFLNEGLIHNDTRLEELMTYNLFYYVDPVAYCWDEDPNNPVSTVPPRTTLAVPLNGAGAMRVTSALAIAVCVLLSFVYPLN